MGIRENFLGWAGQLSCAEDTATWLLAAPWRVVVVAVGSVGRTDVVDCISGCLGTTFITTFFKPLRIPATGFSLRSTGFVTVPATGGLLACNWLSEASALCVISAFVWTVLCDISVVLVEANAPSGFPAKINLVVDEVGIVVDFWGICETSTVLSECFWEVCALDVPGVTGILATPNVTKPGTLAVAGVFNTCWFDDDAGVVDGVLPLLLLLFVIFRCMTFLLSRFFMSCRLLMMQMLEGLPGFCVVLNLERLQIILSLDGCFTCPSESMMALCCVGFNWRIVGLGKIFTKFALGPSWLADSLSGLLFVVLLSGGKLCEWRGFPDAKDFKEVLLPSWVWTPQDTLDTDVGKVWEIDVVVPKISLDVSIRCCVLAFLTKLALVGFWSSLLFNAGLLVETQGDSNVFFALGRPLTEGSTASFDSLGTSTTTSLLLFEFCSLIEGSSLSTWMLRCWNIASTLAPSTSTDSLPNINRFLFSSSVFFVFINCLFASFNSLDSFSNSSIALIPLLSMACLLKYKSASTRSVKTSNFRSLNKSPKWWRRFLSVALLVAFLLEVFGLQSFFCTKWECNSSESSGFMIFIISPSCILAHCKKISISLGKAWMDVSMVPSFVLSGW